jgi:LacI family transcriptional regulator
MKKKVLLKDVAEYVGVSTALVSYVLNNKEKQARVGDEIARKIRKAAADLNYQPNLIAKSLQSGKTNTIGLIVADISNPFFSSIARIIEDEAMRQGYVVIFGSSDESPEKSKRLIDVVRNGSRRIAMMAYDTQLEHMQQRIGGYRQALLDNGIEFHENWLSRISYKDVAHQVDGYIRTLTQPALQVDGFFFATNTLAVESLKPLTRMGIRIPDDLAIVSFDESDAFDLFYPPVTYVSQSLDAIGKGAVDLALARILVRKKKPEQLIIGSRLIIRESSVRKRSK